MALFENLVQETGEADAGDVKLLLHGFVPAVNVMIGVVIPCGLVGVDRVGKEIGLPYQFGFVVVILKEMLAKRCVVVLQEFGILGVAVTL